MSASTDLASLIDDVIDDLDNNDPSAYQIKPAPKADTYVDAIPVRSIRVDHTYQRQLAPTRVARMVAEFDPSLVGVIEVSLRDDGTYAVIDGQHRLAAVRSAKGMGAAIAANVHQGLSPEDEARLFFEIDRKRSRLTGWDKWNARRGALEAVVLEIEAVAATHGLTIAPAAKPNHLRCVAACEKVVDLGGIDLLDESLRVCVAAYAGEPDSLRAELVHGVALILAFYPPGTVNPDRLIAGMQSIAARQITARAAALRETHNGILPRLAAHVIVDRYNAQPGPKLTPFLKAFTTGRKDKDLVATKDGFERFDKSTPNPGRTTP